MDFPSGSLLIILIIRVYFTSYFRLLFFTKDYMDFMDFPSGSLLIILIIRVYFTSD